MKHRIINRNIDFYVIKRRALVRTVPIISSSNGKIELKALNFKSRYSLVKK